MSQPFSTPATEVSREFGGSQTFAGRLIDPLGLSGKGNDQFDISPFTQGVFAERPQFTPVAIDQISPDVEQQLAGIQTDPRALQRLRGEALRTGPSAFTRLRAAQLPGEAALAGGRLRAQTAADLAQAQGQLAARGGLTGGARERLAQESQRSAFAGLRGVEAARASQLGQLALSDEQARQAGLSAQFGREQAALEPAFRRLGVGIQARQFDQQQRAQEAARKTAFDIADLQARQQAAGALAQAKATAESGKK